MIRIKHETLINRSTRDVFEFLADMDNFTKWQSGAVRSELLSDPPMRQGTRFSETVKVGPFKLNTNCFVTDFRPGEVFAFEAMSKPLDYAGSFRLASEAGGTRLTLQAVAQLKGLWRFIEPLLGSDLRREARTELETLRQLLEMAVVA